MRAALLLLLTAIFGAAQTPRIDRVSNGDAIAPGAWISLYGANLAQSTREWRTADFNGAILPTALDGVTVRINGVSAPLAYISPTQLNVLVPSPMATGSVPVTVTTALGASAPATTAVQPVAPTWLAAVHANGASVSPSEPAAPGEQIVLYGSGFAAPVTANIDEFPVAIQFAGLTGPGLFQINVAIPTNITSGIWDLTVSAAGIAAPRLRLSIQAPEGPPVLTAITPNDFIWGQTAAVRLSGTGLSRITAVTLSDPSRLVLGDNPGNQGFQLTVEGNATPGQRTLTVTTPKGVSNPIPFTIRRGEPRITSLTPSTVWPGRIYPFPINGTDTAGVTNIELTPPTGIRIIGGYIQLDSATPTGTVQVRLRTPWDVSPPASLEVVPAPANAPAIGALTPITISRYNANIQGAFSERADYNAEFEFTDANGDIKNGARVEMLIEGTSASSGTIELLAKPGTARFTITKFARSSVSGPFPVWITLFDEAGNRSNTLQSTISVLWQ